MNKIDETLAHHQHYKQECNIANRTIFCHDNLAVLQGINSECIDLIYLDPPFNKKKTFAAPIGTSAEGASFRDIFYQEDVKDEWLKTIEEDHYAIHELLNAVKRIEGRTSYNFCYLAYMAIRLIEMHRILKDNGSIYLHCDSTIGHYLKILLDCIFGEKNFKNDIVWKRKSEKHNLAKKRMPRMYDSILWYAKSSEAHYNVIFTEHTPEYIERIYKYTDDPRGRYGTFPCTNEKGGNKIYDFRGIKRAWRFEYKKMAELYRNNMLTQATPESPFRYKKFLHTTAGVKKDDLWLDILPVRGGASKDYPTQKPVELISRIICASSNEGDVFLDPFCGCATACVSAEQFGRRWIGIDISHKAYELVQERLKQEVWNAPDALHKYKDGYPDIHYSVSPPKRTDSGMHATGAKYVYVISHPKYPDEYKVGIARNYKSRLNTYQTADPDRAYNLEYKIRVSNYRTLEQHIHATFPNKHEWVHGDLQEIIAEIEQNAVTQGEAGELFNET